MLYTCILMVYMGGIYMYIDCEYGCYIHVYSWCIWELYTCILIVYLGVIYMYFGCVYGCYIYIYICRLIVYIDAFYMYIREITKLPNSEQSSKGKVKTHKISQQPENCENYIDGVYGCYLHV